MGMNNAAPEDPSDLADGLTDDLASDLEAVGLKTKRAVLIQVNYPVKFKSQGTSNVVEYMAKILRKHHGYSEDNTVILSEDTKQPTRENILQAIEDLVSGVKPGDSLFFFYSGHDSSIDEAMVPCDAATAGNINSHDFNEVLLKKVPFGCGLTIVLDCYFSGSSLNLPNCYLPSDISPYVKARKYSLDSLYSAAAFVSKIAPAISTRVTNMFYKQPQPDSSPFPGVILISSAFNHQDPKLDSDDLSAGFSGPLASALIDVLRRKPATYRILLSKLQSIVKLDLPQVVELSTSFPLNLDKHFCI